MTHPTPLPPPPTEALPPPPAPPAAGTWPRPPRWLGVGTIARLTRRELRGRPRATALGVVVGLASGAMFAGAFADGTSRPLQPLAIVLLLAVGAALADTTDPTQRDEAAVLIRLGCPRTVIRLVAWAASVVALGLPAAATGWLVTAARTASPDAYLTSSPPDPTRAALQILLLAAVGAATTAGTRLAEHRGRTRARRASRLIARAIVGVVLILAGSLLPSTSRSGTDLDLSMAVALVLVLAGLVALAPVLARLATAALRAVPSASARVASATLAPQRRSLTMTVALLSAVAALLVVQGVLGHGLGARERDRVAAVRALGPATQAGSDRVVLVDRAEARAFGPGQESSVQVRDLVPDGTLAAEVETVAVEVAPPGGRLGNASTGGEGLFSVEHGSVAIATPELLRALGLDPALATGDDAVVLDRRVIDDRGRVRLVPTENPDSVTIGTRTNTPTVRRPAVVAATGAAWTGVPAVLLPRAMFEALPRNVVMTMPGDFATTPRDLVVRFPQRPTDQQVDRLYDLRQVELSRGDERVDLTGTDRTDKTATVWVRTDRDARELALALGTMALVATTIALVSLRLAVRREDAVLAVLGARPRTAATVSALRALGIAVVATATGAAIAFAATAWGIHRYNTSSRLDAQVRLAPIPWSVPTSVVVALVALPLLAAAAGALIGLAGPVGGRGARAADDR